MAELTFLKQLILIKHNKKIFVTIGIFYIKGLGFYQISLIGVMMYYS